MLRRVLRKLRKRGPPERALAFRWCQIVELSLGHRGIRESGSSTNAVEESVGPDEK